MDPFRQHKARAGLRIVAIDGRLLGTVLEGRDDRFLASTPDGIYWLRQDCVFTVVGLEMTLICDASGLKRYVVGALPPFLPRAEPQPSADGRDGSG